MAKDLSILIPARNEMFLKNTIEDALKHIEADTEIIAVLDGVWADPKIEQNERVNIIYLPKSIGQRAATNLACKLSKAKYVMKVDAHCSFDQGFDRKMLEAFKVTGDNVTMDPIMRNLWAFDWKCLSRGTNIVTPSGLKVVESIKKGEKIISGDGLTHKVLRTHKSKPSVDVVRIKPYQLPPIELTKDHPVKVYPYYYKKTNPPNTHITIISKKEEWIEAGKLKNGLYKLIYPFSTKEQAGTFGKLKNKEELARLIGYFIAEGNLYHKSQSGKYLKITFCLNQSESHMANDIEKIIKNNFTNRFGKKANATRINKTDIRSGFKYMRINVYSKDAARFIKKYVMGENARNKKFVPEVLCWPVKLQKILFKAMVAGDGWVGKVRNNMVTTYSTSSKELSHQIFHIMLRLGYLPGILERINIGNFGVGNKSYQLSAYSNTNGHNCKSIIRGNEYLVSVYDVKKIPYNDYVYDLSVDNLPEILTESGVVHNCYYCGWKKYQGPTPEKCGACGKTGKIRRKILWIGKHNPQSTSYCFDSTPHFQYFEDWKHRPKYIKDKEEKGLTETMSLQGSCWMLTREKYWELGICDENFGSWGSQGIEVAVKTWLSGGEVLVNHKTWYAHMFRTQGGDFGFPYPISGRDQEKAKRYAKDLFFNNKWPKQVRPLSWLIEKFWPVKGWTEEDLKKLKENTFSFKEEENKINTEDIEPPEETPKSGIIYQAS